MRSAPETEVDRIERLVRRGELDPARQSLRRLVKRGDVAEGEALRTATLARRLGLVSLSVRILNPLVRPSGKQFRVPTDLEKAEYAASLVRLGAAEEALQILEPLDAARLPQVLLFRTLALVRQWRYAESIALLERYVHSPLLSPYQRLVGKVNLAAALVHERQWERADTVLEELREESARGRHGLLHANALELSAQAAIERGRWSRAEHYLVASEGALPTGSGADLFYVHKWRAILALLTGGAGSHGAYQKVRRQARERHNWETLRDLDRYKAKVTGDRDRFLRLYYGTPFASFRDRLLADFPDAEPPSGGYRWRLGGSGGRAALVDLTAGELVRRGRRTILAPTAIGVRLLQILASDFYRPLRLAELHSRLYPDEHFNPTSSPLRLHQALWRLRQWIEELGLPLRIASQQGYRLAAPEPCAIHVGEPAPGSPRFLWALRRLKAASPDAPFSTGEARKALGMPLRSTIRLLNEAAQKGWLAREGSARATRYRWARAI